MHTDVNEKKNTEEEIPKTREHFVKEISLVTEGNGGRNKTVGKVVSVYVCVYARDECLRKEQWNLRGNNHNIKL